MKRIILSILITALLAGFTCPTFAETPINVIVNGNSVVFHDTPPTIINGRTLVPVRFLSENLGANVEWNQENKIVTITKKDLSCYVNYKNGKSINVLDAEYTVVLQIDNNLLTTYIKGSNVSEVLAFEYAMDIKPILINNRTMLPARFIANSLGYLVSWEDTTKTVSCIKSGTFNEDYGKEETKVAENDEIISTTLNAIYTYNSNILSKDAKNKIERFLNGDNTHKEDLSKFVLITAFTHSKNKLAEYYKNTGFPKTDQELNQEIKEHFNTLAISEQYSKYFVPLSADNEDFINSFFIDGIKFEDIFK